jgi:flagellar export protein FliJ
MAFRYTLQSLLRLRQGLERQEEQRLFAIAALVARLRAELEAFDISRLDERRAFLQEMLNGLPGAVMQFASQCEAASQQSRAKLLAQLADAELRRLEQLRVYQAARQKREVLEGLRERQEGIYDREMAHREQERSDENFLVQRFATSQD